MQTDKKKVGEKIHQIRKQNGYSMEQFGKQIGNAPKGSVNSWEKGVNLPNKERLELIAVMGNMSVYELLYGSLQDYVSELLVSNIRIQVSDEFIGIIMDHMKMLNYSYGNDIEILQMVNRFLSAQGIIEEKTTVLYVPISEKENLYIGKVDRNNELVSTYYAYSDSERNTLHLLPFFLQEHVADFYQYPSTLMRPKEHEYFTADFKSIHLKLNNSTIIYYGIDKKGLTTNTSIFKYDQKSDCYILEDISSTHCKLKSEFSKEQWKEVLHLQQ